MSPVPFQHHHQPQHLKVLLIQKPPSSIPVESHLISKNFHVLKAWESPELLEQILSSHADSIQALICYDDGTNVVDAGFLRQLPALRLVVTITAAVNHIDMAECRQRGIAVANSGMVYSEDVADMAVGLLIDVARNISASDRFVRHGLWKTKGGYPLGFKLGGKRVGIVGLGSIGSEVAKRLEGFGCKISYNSRSQKPSISYPFYSNVKELAAKSDVLIICCELNDKTHHMIDREVLLALGKEGVIINVGRGSIIDEKEMVKCLVNGETRGAGLDVFENEPDVPKELLELDNVVVSPHKAFSTLESIESLCQLVVANLEAFFSNKPLFTPVIG
ncbi:hypothetical protein FEM48_Zijuj12G0131000 [Ziziphus jujuba var. spinosa]|uniref:glyoxylate reductase (NADP(+)) n=1 Tax=Ziziphus jujuba var. spinosa TaxID=714518 RepID=A0A978UDI2_ZIZJJ|nr:hypothetical protein FEM48_Zijuj12G0131000 [Ziziphus jujuba var. spinosa]